MLNEVGVYYSLDPDVQLSLFTYDVWYKDQFVRSATVYVLAGRMQALELINHWNAGNPKLWHYVLD